jgi:hypothetical protein
MARAIERWFVCNSPYRIHSVNQSEVTQSASSKSRTSIGTSAFMDLERLAFSFVRA